MSRWIVLSPLLVLAFVGLAACGGGDDSEGDAQAQAARDLFFELDSADAHAHAALPTIADLPGDGWEVTEEDAFEGEEDDDGFDFAAVAEQAPACGQLADLAALGDIFGGDDETDDTVAQAQIAIERPSQSGLPTGVDTEIEIKPSATEVAAGWNIARGILSAPSTSACITEVITSGFAEQEAFAVLDFEIESVQALAGAPQDGAALAFRLAIALGDVELAGRIEIYVWPLGNAQVTVMFQGSEDELERRFVAETLERIDERVIEAARR